MSIEYNKIDLEKFKAIKYSRNIILFFDPDGKFHQFLGHNAHKCIVVYFSMFLILSFSLPHN